MHRLSNILARIRLISNWYTTVFPFNRFGSPAKILRLRTGATLFTQNIFSSDFGCFMEIFNQDIYALESLSLPPNPTIIDLGANIGLFSLAAHTYFPDAHIISYEPHPDTFSYLQKNAPFATLYNAAVAADGVAFIQAAGISAQRKLAPHGFPVTSYSLNTILQNIPTVDLLKIDIEGSEFPLIENATPATLSKIHRIVMEIHASPHPITTKLQHSGFTYTQSGNIYHFTRNNYPPLD